VRALGDDAAVLVARGTFTVNGGLVFRLASTEVCARRDGKCKLITLDACSDNS
jgi:hypothetical protein